MQGPVYGLVTKESNQMIYCFLIFIMTAFETVVNRFLVQAVTGHPLTVYGNGSR